MVLNIFALLFVLAIAFLNTLFGAYSGLINVFCAITALAVAFGCAEPLNGVLTGQFNLHPSYTEPLSLVLLFVITLVVLRTLTDMFLRGNVRVPRWLDLVGGGVCGFVIAQIVVGVLTVGFLMLPWGGRVAMFSGYERHPENQTYGEAPADEIDPDERRQEERVVFRRNRLWLRSDQFAVGLFELLSGGSLKGATEFATVYPDYTQWVLWSGNTVQPESLTAPIIDDKGNGVRDGLKVEAWWKPDPATLTSDIVRYRKELPTPDNERPKYEPLDYEPQEGRELLAVRLKLEQAAADRDKQNVNHRFRPTMIRLVGDVRTADGTRQPRHYVPQLLGGADPNIGDRLRIVDPDANFSVKPGADSKVDAIFEVDEGFEPRFVEYRRHARAAVSGQPAKSPPAARLAAGGAKAAEEASGKAGRGTQGSGAARFIDNVNRTMSGDTTKLPFPMRPDRLRMALDVTLEGQALVSGRLAGDRETFEAPERDRDSAITDFKRPEGKRLFQLQTKPRSAQSLAGQIMNFVGAATNQYYAIDDAGEKHGLVGYYALVKKDNRPFVELYFAPEDLSFRQMLDFKTEGVRRALTDQDDAVLGLLFAVPPGKTIVAVESQGGKLDFGTDSFKMGQ